MDELYSPTVFTKEDMEYLAAKTKDIRTAANTVSFYDGLEHLLSFLDRKVALAKLVARVPLDDEDD